VERTEARNSSERLNDDIGNLTTILKLHITSETVEKVSIQHFSSLPI